MRVDGNVDHGRGGGRGGIAAPLEEGPPVSKAATAGSGTMALGARVGPSGGGRGWCTVTTPTARPPFAWSCAGIL